MSKFYSRTKTMPAQMRLHEASQEENEALRANDVNNFQQPKEEVESDRSNSPSNRDNEEYVLIKLSDVRKEIQCPICLGIIRKTRTVMECLHRFCRACIDKSMRLGNNECPACRTHCASRRSLRDDPNYDTLIAALYPDVNMYEEEELALDEDEMTHNKQIQASIAQTLQRQTEALGKRRRRSQGNFRTSHLRRRNFRNAGELRISNDNEGRNDNDGGNGSSSDDEQTEIKPTRCIEGGETQFSQHPTSTDADVVGEEKVSEVDIEGIITSSGTLAWGKNGHRSNTRFNGRNSNLNSRNSRIPRFVDYLSGAEEEEVDDKLGIFLLVVSLDDQKIPSLEEPYLQCSSTLSVGKLIKHVALKTAVQEDEVVLRLVEQPGEQQAKVLRGERSVDLNQDTLRVLGEQETMAELTSSNLISGYMIMVYRRKLQNSATVVKTE